MYLFVYTFPILKKSTLPQTVQICVWECTASDRWCDQYWLPAVIQHVLLGRPGTPQPSDTSWKPLYSGQSLGSGLEEGLDLNMRRKILKIKTSQHPEVVAEKLHMKWLVWVWGLHQLQEKIYTKYILIQKSWLKISYPLTNDKEHILLSQCLLTLHFRVCSK